MITGTWTLESLVDVVDGTARKRDYKIEGRLIYTEENRIFVGLGYHKPDGYSSNFYTGKYVIKEDNQIEHLVEVSSDEKRNNTVLERQYNFLDDSTLELKGKNNVGNDVRLVWKKLD